MSSTILHVVDKISFTQYYSNEYSSDTRLVNYLFINGSDTLARTLADIYQVIILKDMKS